MGKCGFRFAYLRYLENVQDFYFMKILVPGRDVFLLQVYFGRFLHVCCRHAMVLEKGRGRKNVIIR